MKLRYHHIRWLVAVAALLVLPAMAQVRDTIDFDISDRTFEAITVDGETFNLYSYPDCDHIDQTGAPMLPVKYIRLSVPYNATNITVTASGDWTSGSAARRIYPAPVPIPTDGSVTEDPEMVIDSTIYMTNAYWPAQPAELVGDGFLMGENHIVTVAVYPMLYNPGASRIRNYSQVRVTVSYTPGGTPANMLVRYDTRLRQQERQQAMALVSNPEQVEPFSIPASQAQHAPVLPLPDSVFTDTIGWTYGGMLKSVESYDYMVITTRALKPAFKRLLALKQQKGYSAGAVCVEDILSNIHVASGDKSQLPDGSFSYINDDAGKIREYLKECYRYGTKFVLFGGKNVPYRYGWNSSINNQSYITEVPTDLYYSELTTNWNKDNDEMFGEKYLYGDTSYYRQFDFNPELYVGRLLCTNESEVENYTNKLLCYELMPGNGDSDYLDRAFYYQYGDAAFNGQANRVHKILKNVIPDSIFITENRPMKYPKGKDIIDLLNDNYGFVSLHTHGNPGHMATSYNKINSHVEKYCIQSLDAQNVMPPNSWQYQEEIGNGFDCMTNAKHPNVLYSIACDVTPFDIYSEKSFSPPHVYNTTMNFGESFTLGKGYGGVAFIGNTRSGLTTTSTNLEVCFATEIVNCNYKVGAAEALSKADLPRGLYRLYVNMIHNLIGDPEFDIWTSVPQQYENMIVTRTDNSITIQNLNGNSTFWVGVNDGLYQSFDSTNVSQLTFTNINPNSTVVAYGHNFLPYIAPLYLQNERIQRSQHVIANDVYAGRNVDPNRTAGDLTIAEGSEYEIETKGQVVLGPGFMVEKGANFSVSRRND